MYEIRFSLAAQKYLKKLKEKKLKDAFKEAILEISENPYAGDEKKGDLAGLYCWNIRYAKTEYRIAYRIMEVEGKYVIVILAGTHEGFYQEIIKYIK